jgi:hypothetical protein
MIIWLLATKDQDMLAGVVTARKKYGAITYFGTISGALPKAGTEEVIKIFAHGNDHEIGEQQGPPAWTPESLSATLYQFLLPGGFRGEIDIDACGSGVMDGDRLTYVDKLLRVMKDTHSFTGKVWGYGGDLKGFGSKEVVEAAGGDLPSGWMKIEARDRN